MLVLLCYHEKLQWITSSPLDSGFSLHENVEVQSHLERTPKGDLSSLCLVMSPLPCSVPALSIHPLAASLWVLNLLQLQPSTPQEQ